MGLLRKIIGYVRTDLDLRRRPSSTSPEVRAALADLDDVDHTARVREREFPERGSRSSPTGDEPRTSGRSDPDDGPGLDDLRRITDR